MSDKNKQIEWQTEITPFGAQRRYHIEGGIKEYEKMIFIDGVEIPESELAAFHARNKAIKEAKRAEMLRQANNRQAVRICPFKANTMQSKCIREACALFVDGCTLTEIGEPTKQTANLKCPLTNRNCTNDCALFRDHGCALTALKNKREDK